MAPSEFVVGDPEQWKLFTERNPAFADMLSPD
jgi:hypothetical protein